MSNSIFDDAKRGFTVEGRGECKAGDAPPEYGVDLLTSGLESEQAERQRVAQESGALLKVWVCTDHKTHWPVGGASVVVAASENEARALLIEALREHGLSQPKGDFTLKEIDLSKPAAVVLNDGDY